MFIDERDNGNLRFVLVWRHKVTGQIWREYRYSTDEIRAEKRRCEECGHTIISADC